MTSETDHARERKRRGGRAPKRTGAGTKVEHFTVGERAARGKAARAEVSRASHGEWEPALHRPDPVELLEEQAQTRVPELVPIRYGRMLVSPFTFYRGAAYLMASDLASGPRTGLHTQLCGDAHLSNFGGFAAPDRRDGVQHQRLRRDAPGPVRVGRQAARRQLRRRGARPRLRPKSSGRRSTVEVGRAYREGIRRFSGMNTLDLWYSRLDVEDLLATVSREIEAEGRQGLRAGAGERRQGPHQGQHEGVREADRGGRRRAPDRRRPAADRADRGGPRRARATRSRSSSAASSARTGARSRATGASCSSASATSTRPARWSGVGSVGTRAWICLMLGRDDQDPLFLQFKEAQPSVLEPFLGRSEFANSGQRVVEGQRLTQAASDIMLGWIKVDAPDGVKRDFYVRQLWDAKTSALVDVMEPRTMIGLRTGLRNRARTRARARRRRNRDRELPRQRATPSTARWHASRRPTPTRTSATTRR